MKQPDFFLVTSYKTKGLKGKKVKRLRFFTFLPLYLLTLILNSPFSILHSFAQSPNCYRITFSDKDNSPYSITRPEEFLSPRAIAKRERFNISVIEQDLPVNSHYIDSILHFSNEPSQIISKSKWDNSVVIFYPETDDSKAIIDEMAEHFSFVMDVLPVAYYKLPFIYEAPIYMQTPVHEEISNAIVNSSSCDYDYGIGIEQIDIHKGQFLHKAGFCGEGMLICAIDAGWEGFDTISYFKPLYQNGQILGTRDLIPCCGNTVYTGGGHGTGVTSLMASAIEGKFVGTAPKANYFFIRSENSFLFGSTNIWDEQLVEENFLAYAMEIADSLGADVINVSLCYRIFDYEWQNIYTPADNNGEASIASRAASTLTQKGVIVVIAAGNEGLTDWHYITHPADASNILAVGNVNKNGKISPTSSYGPSADGRIKPDVASVGWGDWGVWSNGQIIQNGGYGGTSSAAPIIAGLAACLWQALPQYSSLEIMDLIRKYGDRYNNPDDRTGYGIPNFYQCYLDHSNSVPEKQMSSVSVYPNPTTGELRIEVAGQARNDVVNVEIFDVYGRKQKGESRKEKAESVIVLDISALQTGLYFVKITTENGTLTKKVVKY